MLCLTTVNASFSTKKLRFAFADFRLTKTNLKKNYEGLKRNSIFAVRLEKHL
jgi:hypothetical protein